MQPNPTYGLKALIAIPYLAMQFLLRKVRELQGARLHAGDFAGKCHACMQARILFGVSAIETTYNGWRLLSFSTAVYGQYCYCLLSLPNSFIGKQDQNGPTDVENLRLFLDILLLVSYIVTFQGRSNIMEKIYP
jgi:hypothetical protein